MAKQKRLDDTMTATKQQSNQHTWLLCKFYYNRHRLSISDGSCGAVPDDGKGGPLKWQRRHEDKCLRRVKRIVIKLN